MPHALLPKWDELSDRTQELLRGIQEGDRCFLFDCDGTITKHLPEDTENHVAGTANFAFGYAGVHMGLTPEEKLPRFLELQDALRDQRISYNTYFSLIEHECLIEGMDEQSTIVEKMGITAEEMAELRHERGLAPNAYIPLDAGLLEFFGRKFGEWVYEHRHFDPDLLDWMHEMQEPKSTEIRNANGGENVFSHNGSRYINGDRGMDIYIVTISAEDFNKGLCEGLFERYAEEKGWERPIIIKGANGKQFNFDNGCLTYPYSDDDGVYTKHDQPEYGHKWKLLELMEAHGAHVIGMAGDSAKRGRSDDAALRHERDANGDIIPGTTRGEGGLGVGESYAMQRVAAVSTNITDMRRMRDEIHRQKITGDGIRSA